MQITPELIPHSQFHKGIWLLPANGSNWYYFSKKKNINTITNKNFIETVDGPLKELVKFLHARKIKTTPSCSGHHLSIHNLEKKYEGLVEDRKIIRNIGLQLADVQDQKIYLYQNKNYTLPWSKSTFIKKLMVYQQKGVIGLRFGNRKGLKEKLLQLKIKNVEIKESDHIVFIFTHDTTREKSKKTWKEVTKKIKEVFK